MSKPTIEYTDFSKKQGKDFSGVGLFDEDLNKIYIDSRLSDINFGTKKLCLRHELAHYNYRKTNINDVLNHDEEEMFIELEGIVTCGYAYLSIGERIIKRYILKNGKLTFKKDYKEIVNRILSILNINLSLKDIKKIYRRK